MENKKLDPSEMIEVRWKIPKHIHKKIALYQKGNEILTMESAGVKLLDRATEKIKLIDA
jgi:hypothetical protein